MADTFFSMGLQSTYSTSNIAIRLQPELTIGFSFGLCCHTRNLTSSPCLTIISPGFPSLLVLKMDITVCHDSHLNFCGDEARTCAMSSTESTHDVWAYHNMCQSPYIGHGYHCQLSLYCYSCALKDVVQAQTCVMCGIHLYLLGG